jgi:hypothetical protein
MSPIDKARELWEQGTDPQEWGEATTPSETLIYKAGHPRQVQDLYAISHLLGIPVKIAGSHTSKSVGLPVGIFRADIWTEEEVFMFTRDNFHDLKVVVVSSCPIDHLPYDVAHARWTQEIYDEQKRRSFEYCRPKPEKNLSGSHDWDEADYETDAWYDKWSGGTLLRHDGEIYRAGSTASCYYEGIVPILPREVFVRYEHGLKNFAVEVPGDTLRQMKIMQWIVRSAQKFVQARRDRAYDLESLARYRKLIAEGNELTNDYHREKFAELEAKYGDEQ